MINDVRDTHWLNAQEGGRNSFEWNGGREKLDIVWGQTEKCVSKVQPVVVFITMRGTDWKNG